MIFLVPRSLNCDLYSPRTSSPWKQPPQEMYDLLSSKASATLWYWASRDGWVSFPGTQEAFSSSGRELWAGAEGCHRLLGATPQGRECPVTQDGAQTASVGRAKLTVPHTLLPSLLQGRQHQEAAPGAWSNWISARGT